ncbi:hypothetical protein B0T21DRAFT_78836 [Apiosordaria backusii]|uniref:Uncharacterized protein n=1 Tax=Apiosordaria backusii TaxID=314023 RepID=A0AA40DSP8_9PEZI|nr:hypothetical protein B0T21DRAFT_78836 [Apiosordaria backusii]
MVRGRRIAILPSLMSKMAGVTLARCDSDHSSCGDGLTAMQPSGIITISTHKPEAAGCPKRGHRADHVTIAAFSASIVNEPLLAFLSGPEGAELSEFRAKLSIVWSPMRVRLTCSAWTIEP